MYRILLSFLIIAIVCTASAATTYAYFTSSQTIAGNIISVGNLKFEATMTDTTGTVVPSLIANNFAPGIKTTRCIFIKNAGALPGRFKLYRGTDSGSATTLGKFIEVRATLNPSAGECATVIPTGFETLSKAGPQQLAHTTTMLDTNFEKSETTPFKLPSSEPPIEPGQYAVYAFEVNLPPTAAPTGNSYTTGLVVLGIQKEGSDPGTDW